MTTRKKTRINAKRSAERGFSLVEMMVATAMFLVGLIAVAELVPATMLLNLTNRNDSNSVTCAQRELVKMLDRSLADNSFTDLDDGNLIQLGDPLQPNAVVGSSVIMDGNFVRINFLAAQVVGYSFNYTDPEDPTGTVYDIRWAVVTTSQRGTAIAKRFIVGAWRRGGNNYAPPVTLDAWVQR